MKTYKGSCHCGRVAFEVEGSLLWFVPREQLRFLTPEERLSTSTFNKHAIKHKFCATCGIHPLAAVDPACLKVKHFDGRSL